MVPTKEYIDSKYEALLKRKLFLTEGNYARIVELASAASAGESAISIHSKSSRKGDEAVITWSHAQRNLWYAENGDDPAFPRTEIKIERRDAPFPKTLAETISSEISVMLSRTRPMEASGQITVDPVNIEVSVEGWGVRPKRGLLTPDANGVVTSSFRRLLRALQRYCRTSSEARQAELINIADDVNKLAQVQKR